MLGTDMQVYRTPNALHSSGSPCPSVASPTQIRNLTGISADLNFIRCPRVRPKHVRQPSDTVQPAHHLRCNCTSACLPNLQKACGAAESLRYPNIWRNLTFSGGGTEHLVEPFIETLHCSPPGFHTLSYPTAKNMDPTRLMELVNHVQELLKCNT